MAPKRASRASSVASDTKKVTKVTKTATSKAAKSKTTAAKNAVAKKVVVAQKKTVATPRPSTRTSRRLRASEDLEASPLQRFTPEKRTRKNKTTPTPSPELEEEKESTSETGSEAATTSSREGSLETIAEEAQATESIDNTPSATIEETESTASTNNVIEQLEDTPAAAEQPSNSHSVIELMDDTPSATIEPTSTTTSTGDVIDMADDVPTATEQQSETHSIIEIMDDTASAIIAPSEVEDANLDNTFDRLCNESLPVDTTDGALYNLSDFLDFPTSPAPVQSLNDTPPTLPLITQEQEELEERARSIPTWLQKHHPNALSDAQWAMVRTTFAAPSLSPQIPSIAEFEIEAAAQDRRPYDRIDDSPETVKLHHMIAHLSEDQKAKLIIAQRDLLLDQFRVNKNANAKIDTQQKQIQFRNNRSQELKETRREKEELQRQNDELEQNFQSELLKEREEIEQKAQEEVERLEREEQEKNNLAASSSKKRSAPEEDDEDADERPSRRVKLTENLSPQAVEQTVSQAVSHTRATSSSSRLSTIPEASPSSETSMQEASQPQTPPTARRGFLSGVVSSVTNIFPIKRLFGSTPQAPRTEPVRRVLQAVAPSKSNAITPVRRQATVASPSSSTDTTPSRPEQKRRASSDYQMSGAMENAVETPEPETPNLGITKEHFAPQTAPQPRRNFAPPGATPRKTYREKLAVMTALAKKKEAAAETARAEAIIAENNRNEAAEREAAKELRRKDLAAIEATQKPGEKRKDRVDDLEVIPSLGPGRVGIPATFYDSDSDDESTEQEDERPQAPPAKRVRFNEPETPSTKRPWTDGSCFEKVSPHIKTPIPSKTADPHRAQPYTGTMFADKTVSNTNVFDQSVNRDNHKQSPQKVTSEDSLDTANNLKQSQQQVTTDEQLGPIAYGQKYGVWTGPKSSSIQRPPGFNHEGTFSVPDDSDSETELEDSEVKTPEKPVVQPNVIALEKARNDAEKYKPKTPSGLRATSKLSSSPFDTTPTKAPGFNILGAGATPGMPLKRAQEKATESTMALTPAAAPMPTPATFPAVENIPLPTWSLPAPPKPQPAISLASPEIQEVDDMSFEWQWPEPPRNPCTDRQVLEAVDEAVRSPSWIPYVEKTWAGAWTQAVESIQLTHERGEPLGRMPPTPRASQRT